MSSFLFGGNKRERILTISFVFILKNNMFKIKVFLLVAVNPCVLSLFTPRHLRFSFGFDQKTLHLDLLAGHHCHLSREDVPGREGASFVHLVVIHREMLHSHDSTQGLWSERTILPLCKINPIDLLEAGLG